MNQNIPLITYLHSASNDIELTPVFYTTSNSKLLFFRFDYFSKTISRWIKEEELEDWQKSVRYQYAMFINHHHFWWGIDESNEESIAEFLNQYYVIELCLKSQGIKIKDCSDRIFALEQARSNLRHERISKESKVEQVDRIVEKIVGVSRNDIITIYELAAQCCSAYNNLIMLIDKKNISKYVAFAKGTLKQSQYTQDVAEAKYWTDKIKSFTKPMAEFCESMNDLYQQTQGIKSKYNWDHQQPYGKAMDFPLLTQAVINLEYLTKQLPDIITKGEDKEYIQHCRHMAKKQRIY